MMGKGPSRVLALAALAAAAVLAGIVLLLSREDPPGAVPTEAASRPTPGPGAGTGTVPARAGTTDLEGWARRAGSGAPLAVAVAVFLPGGEVLRTDADADGGFRLGGLPRGATVAVEISFPGLATEKLPGLLVPATGRLELPGVVLGSGRRVEARVLAPDGSPVAGARLELLPHSRNGPLPIRPDVPG
ncbi:MAG: carboxypeptidase-like regulatory domain-containing protein, partial [Planctomycetes bacterium]|nr:carboxypeptidase-like regulatory domain-containing protein [Planctomycetota bacterium]